MTTTTQTPVPSEHYVSNMKKTLCEILLQCECGLHPTLVNCGMDDLIRDVLDDKIQGGDEPFIIGLPFSPLR